MASWAKEPMVVVSGMKSLTVLNLVEDILDALRREYTPRHLPTKEMIRDGKVVATAWQSPDGVVHSTLKGWVNMLAGRRAVGTTCNQAHRALEEAFLEMYPPFGEFTAPNWLPWVPGTLKSSHRLPEVEYSLTSVFDSHILPGRDGWRAFHQLITMAEEVFASRRASKNKELKKLWHGVEQAKETGLLLQGAAGLYHYFEHQAGSGPTTTLS